MIRPGRVRRSGPPTLTWHVRIAAWRRRRIRARRAAWAALAAALLGALASGLAAPVTLAVGATFALVIVAMFVATIVPVAGADRWARSWITAREGLGYLTAVESRERDDPYGFGSATRERALARLRDVRPPSADAWWLPPLVAAVLVLLTTPWLARVGGSIPTVPATASVERPGGAARPDGPAPAGDPAGSDDGGGVDAAGAPAERNERERQDAAPAPEARDDAGSDAGRSGRTGAEGDSEAPAQGGAAVDRFLRELGQAREGSSGGARDGGANPFEPAAGPPTSSDGEQTGSDRTDATLGDRPRSEGRAQEDVSGAEVQPSNEGTPGTSGEGASGAGGEDGQARGDGGGEPDGSGQPGGGGAQAAGPEREVPVGANDGASGGANDDRNAGRRPGDAAAGDEGADGGLSEGDPEAAGGAGAGEAGAPAAAQDAGNSGGESAGASSGSEGEGEPMLGSLRGPADRLPGDREGGPAPAVGSIRGGGAAPELVPEGRAASPAEVRSAERAGEEQGLPGAYREIIRRYFR